MELVKGGQLVKGGSVIVIPWVIADKIREYYMKIFTLQSIKF